MKTPQMHQTKAIGDLNNNWLFSENSLRQKNDPAQSVIYSLIYALFQRLNEMKTTGNNYTERNNTWLNVTLGISGGQGPT